MSTENDETFDETEDGQPNESNAAKTLRKQNSKLTKDLSDLQAKLAAFEKKERAGSIAGLLKEHGASEKLARFVDFDGDVSSESVLSWLNENGDAFGWEPAAADDEEVQVERQAARRISGASASAPAGNRPTTVDGIRGMSIEQLIAAGIINR